MIDGMLYANAAAKAHENTLLSADKIVRLGDAPDVAAAVKILAESGYGQNIVPERPENYPEMIERERAASAAFVKSVAPEGSGIECFYLVRDYLNLKILFKKEFFGADGETVSGGVYDVDRLKAAVSGAKPTGLSPEIEEVVASLIERRATTPSAVDTALDRAYFKELARRAVKSRSRLIKDHFVDLIDGKNAITYVRVRRSGLSEKKFGELFVEGGSVGVAAYFKVFGDENALKAVLKGSRVAPLFEGNCENLAEIDRNLDDMLFKRIADARNDMFSEAPLAYYVLGKETEIKTVNVILSAVKNRLPKEEMKIRLRRIYAR